MIGAGVLIVWTDIPSAIEAEFNDWYNREHLPDRILRMPGFLRGRRYEVYNEACSAVANAPKFLTYYDLRDTAVMQSAAHVALRKNRSERDRYFVPQFRHTIKGICDVVHRAGSGGGEFMLLLPVAGRAQEGVAALLAALAAAENVTSAVYAVRNGAITAASSAKDDRAGDRYIEGLIALEAASAGAAKAAASLLTPSALAQAGLATQLIAAPCVLRLMYSLEAPSGKL